MDTFCFVGTFCYILLVLRFSFLFLLRSFLGGHGAQSAPYNQTVRGFGSRRLRTIPTAQGCSAPGRSPMHTVAHERWSLGRSGLEAKAWYAVKVELAAQASSYGAQHSHCRSPHLPLDIMALGLHL